MSQVELHTLDAYREGLADHPRVLLFKHSPICPVSDAAHAEWQQFRSEHPETPTLFVDVIADRPVARGLSDESGIPHASPQAILFADGQPVWNASHNAITAASLSAAWSKD
jgi:bacillithiol system protein YtxJ